MSTRKGLVVALGAACLLGLGILLIARTESNNGPRTAPVPWRLDDGRHPIPESTAVIVHVGPDGQCGSIFDHLQTPQVSYEDRVIVITLTVRVSEGFQACGQTIESDLYTVQLAEPIGDRELVDGARR